MTDALDFLAKVICLRPTLGVAPKTSALRIGVKNRANADRSSICEETPDMLTVKLTAKRKTSTKTAKNAAKNKLSNACNANTAANTTSLAPSSNATPTASTAHNIDATVATDPHLSAVLAAWASLPEAVKLGIAAITNATPPAPPAR